MFKLQTTARACIRGLCVNDGASYLVGAGTDGTLSVLEIGKPKGERFSKQIASY